MKVYCITLFEVNTIETCSYLYYSKMNIIQYDRQSHFFEVPFPQIAAALMNLSIYVEALQVS